jgi:beta-aspartyl-peptidase (threonine type)
LALLSSWRARQSDTSVAIGYRRLVTGPGDVAPLVLVHGGAGTPGAEIRAEEAPIRQALLDAIERAREVLEPGGDAVQAALAAVEMLEDCPLFNAGHGSALCSDGTVEMSAALMRGEDRAAGAVAALRTIAHPIAAAHIVLERREVLVIGEAAERLAAAAGAERRDNASFVTERERERLLAGIAAGEEHGTVGAVCRDRRGTLAAATSTGGIGGQPPGRVGDSPLIGAGTWADEHVAVSCTGDGEAFIRTGVARHVATLLGCGWELPEAVDAALAGVSAAGGRGGLIALAADGTMTMAFTTEAMLRASWRAGEAPCAWVGEPG